MKSVRKLLKTKENLEKTSKPSKEIHSDKEDQVAKKFPRINSQNRKESKKGKSIFHK